MGQSPSSKVTTVTQLVKQFHAFYGTWRFNTIFTTARWIESTPLKTYFLKIHSNIIFPRMLRSSESFLTFRFSDKKFVCIFHVKTTRSLHYS